MRLTQWLSGCAIAGGTGVILIEPILGWEGFVALTGADTDLRIIGGAVALVGVLTLLVIALERRGTLDDKGSSHD
jgi:hypothetical protein